MSLQEPLLPRRPDTSAPEYGTVLIHSSSQRSYLSDVTDGAPLDALAISVLFLVSGNILRCIGFAGPFLSILSFLDAHSLANLETTSHLMRNRLQTEGAWQASLLRDFLRPLGAVL